MKPLITEAPEATKPVHLRSSPHHSGGGLALSSSSSERLPIPTRWHSGGSPHSPSSPAKSPLLTPSSLLDKLPSSWGGRRSSVHGLTWDANGYAELPDDPRLVLEDLEDSIEPGSEPVQILDSGLPATRRIPAEAAFTLTFEGALPTDTTFELKELAPALVQSGEYELSILWMGENGLFANIAAAKSIDYHQGKRLLASSETNTLLWRNDLGGQRCSVSIQKERWFVRAREMRDQSYRWELRYAPLDQHPWHHSSENLVSPRDFEAGLFPTSGSASSPFTESPGGSDYFNMTPPVQQHSKTPQTTRLSQVELCNDTPIRFELSLHEHDHDAPIPKSA